MAARMTLERILRDDNDDSGQTIRDWKIEADPGHITIRLKHGDGFILLRLADIQVFVADLERARNAAVSLSSDGHSR
jgi:hypothetical protein